MDAPGQGSLDGRDLRLDSEVALAVTEGADHSPNRVVDLRDVLAEEARRAHPLHVAPRVVRGHDGLASRIRCGTHVLSYRPAVGGEPGMVGCHRGSDCEDSIPVMGESEPPGLAAGGGFGPSTKGMVETGNQPGTGRSSVEGAGMVTQGGQLRRDDLLLDLGAGGHLPAVTALSSSSDSRMSSGRSRRFVSLTQRSTATLKTAIPASAASVAAGPVAPRRRSASVSAEASDASLISSRSRSSALAAMTVWRWRALWAARPAIPGGSRAVAPSCRGRLSVGGVGAGQSVDDLVDVQRVTWLRNGRR